MKKSQANVAPAVRRGAVGRAGTSIARRPASPGGATGISVSGGTTVSSERQSSHRNSRPSFTRVAESRSRHGCAQGRAGCPSWARIELCARCKGASSAACLRGFGLTGSRRDRLQDPAAESRRHLLDSGRRHGSSIPASVNSKRRSGRGARTSSSTAARQIAILSASRRVWRTRETTTIEATDSPNRKSSSCVRKITSAPDSRVRIRASEAPRHPSVMMCSTCRLSA